MVLLIFLVLDTFTLLLAITAGILVGNQFSPDSFVFLTVFLVSRIFVYSFWFYKIKNLKVPWLRFFLHTLFLVIVIPMFIAALGLLLPTANNLIYWYLAVPIATIILSFGIHKIYPLS